MAIAARWQAACFNRPGFDLFDCDVYALCGDGCMMEGVASEAASLAGHLQLRNLCWIYDNNHITIEGSTSLAFSDDVATRFLAYGWNVTRVGDANDAAMLARALTQTIWSPPRSDRSKGTRDEYGSVVGAGGSGPVRVARLHPAPSDHER